MPLDPLTSALAAIPSRSWAVGVSGGADSVALLLLLLHRRPDLSLHVVHLDHQTRGEESTADAAFVRDLANQLALPCTIALRSDVEAMMTDLPANASSRYRAVRIALFRETVARHYLAGVLLAHHADDQAETVMVRLLRGSGPMGLAGMESVTDLGGLQIRRPMLGVPRALLRGVLAEADQPWREDASNASDKYLRNRIRQLLEVDTPLVTDLLNLGKACNDLRDWARSAAPELKPTFPIAQLADLPELLASESARRWLIDRGVSPAQILPATLARLINLARDAGSAPKVQFPNGVFVRRRIGTISAYPVSCS